MTASNANIFTGPTGVLPVVNAQGQLYEEVQVATAGQTVFTLTTFAYTPGTRSIFVVKNGLELRRAVQYVETDTTHVTLTAGATVGDVIIFKAFAVSQTLSPLQNNGVIPAGLVNQVLAKSSGSDYALRWLDLSGIATLLDQPRQNVASAPTVDLTPYAAVTRNIQITGSTQIDGFAITNGQVFLVKFAAALTLSSNANLVTQTGSAIAVQAGDTCIVRATADNVVEILCYARAAANLVARSSVRQTVQSGPITAGVPTPGGATGGTVVTTTNISNASPWVINAAGGNFPDRIGIAVANLVYTGLATNGTMYLFNDVDSAGNITTFTSVLAPTYQESGARSITNGQFTFNVGEMYATVGSGAAANQAFRVCVGEVTVAGGVVTAIVWYAYNARYDSGWTNTLPGAATAVSRSHNIGVSPDISNFTIECINADATYNPGARFNAPSFYTIDGVGRMPLAVSANSKAMSITTGASTAFSIGNSTTGAGVAITGANWKYKFTASRGW